MRDSSGTALWFKADVQGRELNVVVEGRADYEHPLGVGAGSAAPNSFSYSLTILDADGRLLSRQHADVGETGPSQPQHGPTWHLQLGGYTQLVDQRPETEWLDVPRWQLLPTDVVLVCELLTYSFYYDLWNTLGQEVLWSQWVRRAESLAFSHYIVRLNDYWSSRSSSRSWLASSCNKTNTWTRLAAVQP